MKKRKSMQTPNVESDSGVIMKELGIAGPGRKHYDGL